MTKEERILYQKLTECKFDEKNIENTLFTLTGVLSVLILTSWAFKKNSEIMQFTQNVLKEDYKFYLFNSRTLLYSRIVKDLYRDHHEGNNQSIIAKALAIQDFVFDRLSINGNPSENIEKRKRSKNSSSAKSIEAWRKVINQEKEDN